MNVTHELIFLKHSRQSAGSSDRSPQSSSVSHFHQKGMHLSFLHTNYRGQREIDHLDRLMMGHHTRAPVL